MKTIYSTIKEFPELASETLVPLAKSEYKELLYPFTAFESPNG